MILITGDAGFIGKRLVSLLETFSEVVGYDLQRGEDIRDSNKLWTVFEEIKPEIVIHLAAKTGVRKSKLFPEEYISTNITGTHNIVESCEMFGVKKLIFFSSSSVFGNTIPPVSETTIKNPISLYGITKVAGEQLVMASKIPSVIVRPFTVYGENGRKDSVLWRWIEQVKLGSPLTIYGDGRSYRGYVYIEDLIEVVSKLVQMIWPWNKEDFNIGGSEIIYLDDIIKIFRRIFPSLREEWTPSQEGDIYQQYANTEKAKRILRFDPEPRFFEVVERIIQIN